MPSLLNKIQSDLKAAMQRKDELRLSVLRLLISAVRNKEIALREDEKKVELTDEQVAEIVKTEIKKRRDAIDAYRQGDRPELAEAEEKEKKVLEEYLPAQLSDDEIEAIITKVMEMGETNFGKIMGEVMKQAGGQADGTRVSALVKKML